MSAILTPSGKVRQNQPVTIFARLQSDLLVPLTVASIEELKGEAWNVATPATKSWGPVALDHESLI